MVLIIAHNLYSDNHKNNFIVFVEGPTYDINGIIGATEKKINISFSKAMTKFCWSLYYNGDNNYLFSEKKSISLKQIMKLTILQLFCLGSISKSS